MGDHCVASETSAPAMQLDTRPARLTSFFTRATNCRLSPQPRENWIARGSRTEMNCRYLANQHGTQQTV
ncbi:hypothetical protein ElyMa_000634700 [Elysia marginata]|uniref:Sema domain-containing protein n=1 Tax=Elysia marginata TaxID=1093978 RepID=A0AAV4GCP9_9GAST|nr:hypothetical protein ElyMa_000634700 [Elysia marginata]